MILKGVESTTIILDKKIYDTLSSTEKAVIDYIENNQDNMETHSITSIAKKTYTSVATVSRAIRKLGFDGGITELRFYITKQSQKSTAETELTYHMNDILMKSYRECVMTIENMSISNIFQIVNMIKEATRIYIFALGSSAMVASDFRDQLLYLGFNSVLINDEVVMMRSKFKMKPTDLAIFVTALNTSPYLYRMGKFCASSHMKIATICCKEHTNLGSISDVVIIGHSETVTNSNIMTTTSRIPLMIILRTIVEYVGL